MNKKWALITGASKGLGFEYCDLLLTKGYDIIGVARNTDSLGELQKKHSEREVVAINMDLSNNDNCFKLIEEVKDKNIELVINNAGYGVWGMFEKSDIQSEMNMIDLNIKALHILTKEFVKIFKEKNVGRIINVGSMAAFTPGPVFAGYYASKAYVTSLGEAVNLELKMAKSKARVITICPGPLKTDFWNRSSNQIDATYYSKVKVMSTRTYAIKSLRKCLKTNKSVIIIGKMNKLAKFGINIAPRSTVLKKIYKYQKER
ncbi:SDR family NAD(P)-dependent oxidoreductase [Spiroplasma endosymbiont of Othius punctulatus]|uniref:SDR family NAD(P)-dependent oxidoreductase n=1 Tax=Spiroplasma endosymbiont of Othius punctulatus TaxID=3066289 RepID=UPI0030D17E6C